MELTHSIPYEESGGEDIKEKSERVKGRGRERTLHPRKFSCVELIILFLSSKFLKTVMCSSWEQDEIQSREGNFLYLILRKF